MKREMSIRGFQLPASSLGLQLSARANLSWELIAGSWQLSEERLRQPTVNRDDVAGGLGALIAGEEADRVRVVLRQDRPAGDRALGVELGELVAQIFGRLRLVEGDRIFLQR